MRPGQSSPGKLPHETAYRFSREASMRPGQSSPGKHGYRFWKFKETESASMRPGQSSPGKPPKELNDLLDEISASMRPGQSSPGKPIAIPLFQYHRGSFNEAGAIKPRKTKQNGRGNRMGRSFNEAGAIKPRKTGKASTKYPLDPMASMRPGQSSPGKLNGFRIEKTAKDMLQ